MFIKMLIQCSLTQGTVGKGRAGSAVIISFSACKTVGLAQDVDNAMRGALLTVS